MRHAIRLAMTLLALWTGNALAASCDSACLNGQLDRYLSALTARDPSKLKLAPSVRYTENGSALKVGEGLWAKATELGKYRQRFADATSQQALFIGIVNEGGAPTIAAIRLGIRDDAIAEIEHVVARKGSHALFAPEGFVSPHPSLSSVIAPAKRLPRERLIAIADSYFVGIEQHDSKVIFANDACQRFENGVATTNQPGRTSRNCAHSADLLTYIKSVDDRRYPIVDVEHGIVVSTILFDIPPNQNVNSAQISQDPQAAARMLQPRTLLLTEWFKIDDGKIQHIEAIMHNLPHGSKSGWEKK